MSKRILITGAAGFIGFHLSRLCLATSVEEGVGKFVDWYRQYYGV